MRYPRFLIHVFLIACCLAILPATRSQTINTLKAGFQNPPDSCRPGVYWYFMDGNISRKGMTADLESMKKVGIGSVVFLEVNVGIPRGPVDFLSREWLDLFAHAVHECERLGITMTLGVGPGWTGSGGPWVKPAQSMQHLVSASIQVTPADRNIKLPIPQPKKPFFGIGTLTADHKTEWNAFYEDVAVLAFPTPAIDTPVANTIETALYSRAPFSSVKGVKPYLASSESFDAGLTASYIRKNTILDLTKYLKADGTLDWRPTSGKWTIMRFGTRNNGAVTRPAPQQGLGFEADKFDTVAMKSHLDNYVGKLISAASPLNKNSAGGLKNLHMDSWEMGAQNWTKNFRSEFIKRRGYDPIVYYPVYSGHLVENAAISERFLWDLRQTAQELVLDYHARFLRDYSHRNGFRLSVEPYDMDPTADLELGNTGDISMCEFWSKDHGFNTAFSCVEATSIAHIKSQSVVQAEAFTAEGSEGFKQYPGSMKNQGDWAFAAGINKFFYHTFQHQSLNDSLRPGMTMSQYGVHWDRGQTWWPMAGDYHRYIARCQYLLQQGRSVADILYLIPEGAPHVFEAPASAFEGTSLMPDRKGYNFDACAPSQLLQAEVKANKIVFPGGASYSLLVLPASHTMTPKLLGKIASLLNAGATIVGLPPARSPGLTDYPNCDREINSLVNKVWGSSTVPAAITYRKVGNGKLIWGGNIRFENDSNLYPDYETAAGILRQMKLQEDFKSNGDIRYIHRSGVGWDMYFISNRSGKSISADCIFGTTSGTPQLWDAITGERRALPEFSKEKSSTTIPFLFDADQSFFVVFTNEKLPAKTAANFPKQKLLTELSGPWKLAFDPKWGGPAEIVFDKLEDWSTRSEEGIRYYSGMVKYTKTFDLDKWKDAAILDLGDVQNMARVKLNGTDLGVVWTKNKLNISNNLRPTGNILEIEVANLWPNRLIGDQKLPADGPSGGKWPEWLLQGNKRSSGRYSFVAYQHYKADSPLLKSGLLGPVRIFSE